MVLLRAPAHKVGLEAPPPGGVFGWNQASTSSLGIRPCLPQQRSCATPPSAEGERPDVTSAIGAGLQRLIEFLGR